METFTQKHSLINTKKYNVMNVSTLLQKGRILAICLLFCCTFNFSHAQRIGINTTGATPRVDALLDVDAFPNNDKGILIPRLHTPEQNAIASPDSGLLVYNLDCEVFEYWNGSAWISFPAAGPPAAGSITGSPTVCPGQTGVAYSVPVIPGASSYVWTYSGNGATITGSNPVSIDFSPTATAGILSVMGTNSCGNGAISLPYLITMSGGGSGSQTFTYSGTTQTFVVPSCVYSITVKAWGAGGGGGGADCSGSLFGGTGGGGACVVSTLTVVPTSTLTVVVGGGGTGGIKVTSPGGNGTGGWGDLIVGGGAAASVPGSAGNAMSGGGGGGAASAIYNGTTVNLANTLLVAAGGGGGGGGDDEGGTCTQPGGGYGGGGGQNGHLASSNATPAGVTGTSANGNGVNSATACTCGNSGGASSGGGGGGGYNGGTAGGEISSGSDGSACGGGGGSSYSSGTGTTTYNGAITVAGNNGDPSLAGNATGGTAGVSFTAGGKGGNGIIVISW